MTSRSFDFVAEEPQLIPRGIGEAVARMARLRWPRDTAKHIARAWDLDPKTAENVTRGHCSERTLTKAIRAEGWALLAPLGEALTGKTYDQHLTHLIEETERAARRAEHRRAELLDLEARAASLGRLEHRPVA